MRDYLESLTREQLLEIVLRLYEETLRLRRELDDATGVIR